MFGRESIIPVDLKFPNRKELIYTAIVEPKTITPNELEPEYELDKNAKINKIDVRDDNARTN
jgi:hypothetical protein